MKERLGSFRDVRLIFLLAAAVAAGSATAIADESAAARASSLIRKRMYRDAARILQKAIDQKGGQDAGVELRLLGESYYLQGEYGKARPLFSRALSQQKTTKGKTICEARLAVLAYRLKDYRGARERIDNFLRKYPTDKRAGTMYVMRVKMINAGGGKSLDKLKQIEADYRKLADNKKRYGYYNSVLVSQVLGDLYTKTGREDQAIGLYTTAVHEMRGLIAEFKADDRTIPRDLMQGVDSMSLQIGHYYYKRKNWNEAQKWLENVDYVEPLMWKSKLMLAQMQYRRGAYSWVAQILSDQFLRTVPEGKTKANMRLLLGLSEMNRMGGNRERAKEQLKLVGDDVTGYHQAQHSLGDIYREQKDPGRAEKFYLVSVKAPKYAPAANFYLGEIYKKRGDAVEGLDDKSVARRKTLHQKAAGYFGELITKYPLTALAKQAKPMLDELQGRGVDVSVALKTEDRLKLWEDTIKNKPKSNEAAQALISLAEYHAQTLQAVDQKTAVIKAANWGKCGKACGQILANGMTPFQGVTPERWKVLRARALYLMGRAELGSLPLPPSAMRLTGERAVPMAKGGDADRAAMLLNQALKLTGQDKKQFRGDIELSMVEAMFKSKHPATRDGAERRYAEMEKQYGKDSRYQRLVLAVADWQVGQELFESAARIYRKLARKADLDRDEVMHLLYLSGIYYSRAGRKAKKAQRSAANLGFYIYPKEVLQMLPLIKTHAPFRNTKRIFWETTGPSLTAEQVLRRVSKEFAVPFVWGPDGSPGSVADYLKKTRITRAKIVQYRAAKTLVEYLDLIIDQKRFKMDFDLGANGGKPTIDPFDEDAFETADQSRVIEIYSPTRERFPTLAKAYGHFSSVHSGGAMMFHVVKRIEELTGSKIFWAEGVDKEDALAKEYKQLPGAAAGFVPCTLVLKRTLEPIGLSYKVIRRDRAEELFRVSNECFNELRQFGQNTTYAEEAMFNLAINFHYLDDGVKQKLVLREYLKVFDDPSYAHYYDACFWLGHAFERDRRLRDAIKHYTLAAEESVILTKLEPGMDLAPRDEVRKRLSYDTLFNLCLKATGSFKGAPLDDVTSFVRFNTNVDIKLEESASAVTNKIVRAPFVNMMCFDLLYGTMKELGLDLKTENGDKAVAEKSYYRLAKVYMKDDLVHDALEQINTLLTRFPNTRRKIDALKLKLDAFKQLKDYRNVLEVLGHLKAASKGVVATYMLDYETGRIYFDMCDYDKAAEFYSKALSGTKSQDDWMKIREGLAYAYARQDKTLQDALGQYKSLMRLETASIRHSINTLMTYYLEYAVSTNRVRKPLPAKEGEFIKSYEAMTDDERATLGPNDLARATWIYYVVGMQDMLEGKLEDSVKKFDAAGLSPDQLLAGEALLKAGLAQMKLRKYDEAKNTFQHLLFATKAVEPTVRGTYYLGLCYQEMANPDAAFRRMQELVDKFPVSPYAEMVKANELYQQRTGTVPEPATTEPAEGDGGKAPTDRAAAAPAKEKV
ncbi:tetratricopeptide repeat protein [Verrucomicrobiota bacterium]